MTPQALITQLQQAADSVAFSDVIATIEQHYDYAPQGFSNGLGDDPVVSAAGSNEGSCKIFAFAQRAGLDREQTLACFGGYYRDDVLGDPDGDNHANIRRFMRDGWDGICFDGPVLSPRSADAL